MPDWTRTWRIVVPIVLIIMVSATTMGTAWHHHSRYSADQCTLCHLVIAPGAASVGAQALMLATPEFAIYSHSFVPYLTADQKPPRAPPV